MEGKGVDDPFAVFGEDSDDDEDGDNDLTSSYSTPTQKMVRNALMAKAKAKDANEVNDLNESIENHDVPLEDWNQLHLPWPTPHYVGPIQAAASLPFGGGRGWVAQRRLSPGTLILVEDPVLNWSATSVDLETLELLVQEENAAELFHFLEHLHPTKTVVDSGRGDNEQVIKMLDTMRSKYNASSLLSQILSTATEKQIRNSNGSSLDTTDLYRLLLALRYNGLESGIYLYAALLNHADPPNCVKFLPTDDVSYSEVRTIRTIERGDPLTISYLGRVLSHATRRERLWDQHRFDIGGTITKLDLIAGRHPPSSLKSGDNDSPTRRIESTLLALEDSHDEVLHDPTKVEEAKALEQAALVLSTEAKRQLQNDEHILLLPCLQLHVDCCDVVQRDATLGLDSRIKLLQRLIISCRQLLQLQQAYYGNDYFDIARTALDLAQAIEELLSRSPNALLELGLVGLHSIDACSTYEHRLRRDHSRVKALYPRDASTYCVLPSQGDSGLTKDTAQMAQE